MKSIINRLRAVLLGAFTVLGLVFHANSQTTLTIDSARPWVGYMVWSALPGDAAGYGGNNGGGQAWGTGALTAAFDPTGTNTLTLIPNTNCYSASNPYWANADGSGANNMSASFYVQNDALEGQGVTFSGMCLTNTLVSPYTNVIFIKEFNSGYGVINQTYATPVTGQPFSLFLQTGSGTHVQYGFTTTGPDANAATVSSLGEVVFAENSADPKVSAVTGQAAVQGQSATFNVTASGTAPFSYQWAQITGGTTNVLSNGGRYSGATTNSLTISNVALSDAGIYTVTVTNAVGTGSASAPLTVVSLAQAQTNLLVNPSFESGVFDTTGKAGWVNFSGSVFANPSGFYYNSTTPVSVLDGTNCLQVYASGAYDGVYQERPALPGQVYTAFVWFLTPASDQISGSNTCFLEVQFHDTNGTTLADFESPVVNTNTPTATWIQFSPTNRIVSPAGTAAVHFQITYHNTGSGGSVYVDAADLRLRAPMTTVAKSGANFNLTFPTVPGPTYQVFYKTNLTDPSWTFLTSVVGDGNPHTVPDPIGATNRFYIVNTQP